MEPGSVPMSRCRSFSLMYCLVSPTMRLEARSTLAKAITSRPGAVHASDASTMLSAEVLPTLRAIEQITVIGGFEGQP